MKHIQNTDMYSMENPNAIQHSLRPSRRLSNVLMHSVDENDVVIGDPTDFDIHDQYNDFDHGWDLDDSEVFVGMR